MIGRHQRSGAPLGGTHAVREARPRHALPRRRPHPRRRATNRGATILRRGYDTDDGLLFLAFQQGPAPPVRPAPATARATTTPCTRSRAASGSALFAIPPGARRQLLAKPCCTLNDRALSQCHPLLRPRLPLGLVGLPCIAALQWRYGDQLDWRHVMIGLTETGDVYEKRGYTPAGQARGYRTFRERGMPFATEPREQRPRHVADVPRRRRHPPARPRARVRRLPRAAVRAVHEHRASSRTRRRCTTRSPGCPASTPTRSSPPRATPRTERVFEADRDEARTAEGGPTEFQGKSANTDGRVRFTAPSLRFTNGRHHARGRRLPVLRGLRRRDRQPRPDARRAARPPRTSPRSCRSSPTA